MTVLRDCDDPTSILLSEQWARREDYDAYTAWRAARRDFDRLAPLLKQPLRRRFFNPIPA